MAICRSPSLMRSVGPRLRASPVRNLSAATARHLTPNLEPESRRPRRAARHGVRHAASVARCAVCGAAWCAACGVRVRRGAECAACGEARRAACGVVRREACGAARRGACSETQPAACGAVRHGVSVWRRGGRVRACFLAFIRYKKGVVEITPRFETAFVLACHYAISKLCQGMCHHYGASHVSPRLHIHRFRP